MKRNKQLLILIWFLLPAAVFAKETENVLTVAMTASDMAMDPLHAYSTDELQIATGIYEGLVSYNPKTLQPVPGVAYKWEISESGTVYTFYIRERAKFSNGDQVTAQDFRDSWLRIINPDEEGEYSFLFDIIKGAEDYRNGRNRDPKSVGIRVVSPTILEVELEKPASHFLSMLPHMSFAPIHHSYRDTKGWEWAPLVSNGPFTLKSRTSDEIILEKNPRYWDRWQVSLDRIRIITGSDPEKTAELLNEGAVQWADYADTDKIDNPALIQVSPLFATSYLYFRTDADPWSDSRVRKGVALIIPWNDLRGNASSFATSTLVPQAGFYDKPATLEDMNVEQGLKLLAEAGYPNGRGLPDIKALVTPGSVAELVLNKAAGIWKERLGISTQIVPVSFNAYQEVVRKGGYVIGSSTWIGDFADPLSFLQMWTTGSKLNDAKYSSESYDKLIDEAMSDTSDTRYDLYAQAEGLLLSEDVVVIPLSNPPSINLVDLAGITGWYANALDIHPFKYIAPKEAQVPKWYVSVPEDEEARLAAAPLTDKNVSGEFMK